MRHNMFLLLTILIALIVLASACSNNKNNNPTGPNNSTALPYPLRIDAPEQGMLYSGDTLAGRTSVYLSIAIVYSGLFNPPANSPDTNFITNGIDTTITTWQTDQLTMQLIYSQQLETNDWRVIYNGSQSGQVYSNWIFIDAEQSKEGGIGWMNQYRDTSVEIEYRWSWQVEGGKQAMYMNWLDQQDSVKFKVLFNSGTNGYSEYYLNKMLSNGKSTGTAPIAM